MSVTVAGRLERLARFVRERVTEPEPESGGTPERKYWTWRAFRRDTTVTRRITEAQERDRQRWLTRAGTPSRHPAREGMRGSSEPPRSPLTAMTNQMHNFTIQ